MVISEEFCHRHHYNLSQTSLQFVARVILEQQKEDDDEGNKDELRNAVNFEQEASAETSLEDQKEGGIMCEK